MHRPRGDAGRTLYGTQLAAGRKASAKYYAKKHTERFGPGAGDQRGKHGIEKRAGRRHYRWNVGRMISTEGYALIRVGYEHPLAGPNGYAYEHLVIWVAAGNPRPGKGEVLAFRNGDKADARLRNLKLVPRRVLLAQNRVYIGNGANGQLVAEARP